MAHPSGHYGLCSNGASRVVLVLLAIFLAGYTVRPLFYSTRGSSTQASNCPCDCDCSEELSFLPLDCGENDPDMREELKKGMVTMLSEEISLQKIVANESLEHTAELTFDARRVSLKYQREAEKCNARMEVCEEGRERAQAELVEERKLTNLWEKRARGFGWQES